MIAARRLALTTIRNTRDLGGFPVPGGVTRYGAFVRSEAPIDFSQEDLHRLLDYGIRTSIDLRSEMERSRRPSQLADRTDYRRIPLISGLASFMTKSDDEFNWGDHYIRFMEDGAIWLRDVLKACAEAQDAVLIHCSAGKDRTGIIVACLLSIAGVSEEDIEADYCISELYLQHLYEKIIERSQKLYPDDPYTMDSPVLRTNAENMKTLLKYMDETHGGIVPYLQSIGIPEDVFRAIRKKLTGR